MRAFVGVPLPPLEGLRRLLADLHTAGADYKLVAPENFHLTLRFLGEIPGDQAGPIAAALRAQPHPPPFALIVQDVGAFPDWKKANVLWAGIRDPTGSLAKLYLEIERALGAIGLPGEGRAYAPHLTLGRKRSERGQEAVRNLFTSRRGAVFGEVEVDRFVLYESTLSRAGPRYERLAEVAL